MARLALMLDLLECAYKQDLKERRNLRVMARNRNNEFAISDNEFKRTYGVDKVLFEDILNDLEPLMSRPQRRGDIPSEYKILVALSFYATGSHQRTVGGRPGTMMSQQAASMAIREVTDALNSNEILNKWLKFPQTSMERDLVQGRFYEKFHIPAVTGCIQGTHVAIIKPSQNEELFYNRKGFHSKNVLIISDADFNILNVDCTHGGATHASLIWQQHPVRDHLSDVINVGERAFLLGDSSYPQREYMMTPIQDSLPGSAEEYYTKIHHTAHHTVQRTIEVLKNRWACLKGNRPLHYHPDKAARIIIACCVLHNICNQAHPGLVDIEDTIPVRKIQGVPEDLGSSEELEKGYQAREQLVRELWSDRTRSLDSMT